MLNLRSRPETFTPPLLLDSQLREAEERARVAFAAMEAKRQEQANQFADKIAGVASGEMGRIEAIELDFREQGRCLKEALEANQHTNRRRTEGIHDEVKSLEGRLRMLIADAQEEESARVGSTMQQTQEQVNGSCALCGCKEYKVSTTVRILAG